jgi:hypothetical protein
MRKQGRSSDGSALFLFVFVLITSLNAVHRRKPIADILLRSREPA